MAETVIDSMKKKARRVRSLTRSAAFIALLVVIIATGCMSIRSLAQSVPSDARIAFAAFVGRQQSVLSKLTAFEMKGTITIVSSDEYLKSAGGRKTTRRKFSIIGKGDEIKEVIELLDEAGKVSSTRTYYLNAKQVVQVDDQDGPLARIFSLGAENIGLFNEYPPFLEYAFLNLSIGYAGIPALRVAELVSKEKWEKMAGSVEDVTIVKDKAMHVLVKGVEGSASVNLKLSSEKGEYQIGDVSFFTKENTIDRKIEVLEVVHDKELGVFGKKFKVSVYDDAPSIASPSVIWEYEITDIKLNAPIDDEALVFDPASVGVIYDGDSRVFIKIPK